MFFLNPVIEEALAAVEPRRLMVEQIKVKGSTLFIQNTPFDLNKYHRVHVIGAGKGVTFLFEGLNQVLGERLVGGVVVGLSPHAFVHPTVAFYPGAHPIPDVSSLAAGRAVLDYVSTRVEPTDLVFFLLTGGASALMVLPVDGVSLADKMVMTHLLLSSGAEIKEINTVRKALSALKGGKLARRIYPARVITLIVSDIVDSPLADIGSGPTVPSPVLVSDVFGILEKYHLTPHIPPAVAVYLQNHMKVETENKPVLTENVHFLLGDNRMALVAAQRAAQKLGISAHILTSRDQGDVEGAAKMYAAIIKEIVYTGTPFKPPVLLLCGGELTVTLTPLQGATAVTGRGGRNQELVLHLLKELKGVKSPFYIASLGTDGIDGPTNAAGGWIDHLTMDKIPAGELDKALNTHDSYRLLATLQQLICTGPTRTNVMDLRLFYIG